MNLNKIRPENNAENLLLSITVNCEIPNEQTHKKPEETLEFKQTEQRETISFKYQSQMKDPR